MDRWDSLESHITAQPSPSTQSSVSHLRSRLSAYLISAADDHDHGHDEVGDHDLGYGWLAGWLASVGVGVGVGDGDGLNNNEWGSFQYWLWLCISRPCPAKAKKIPPELLFLSLIHLALSNTNTNTNTNKEREIERERSKIQRYKRDISHHIASPPLAKPTYEPPQQLRVLHPGSLNCI